MKKSKRQSRGQDRISGLPDAVLCHILSFVQTIYAVRTSVLSTRWKNIWESVPSLDFDRGPFRAPAKLKTFADHVLFLRNASNIQKFRLHWKYNGIDHSRINLWIRSAVKRNVVELDLFVKSTHAIKFNIFELPTSIFLCRTLMVLKLRSNFIANIPVSGCFPSLKFLHVTVDHFLDDSIVNLFKNCPVLEDLTIDGSYGFSVLHVAAPALKTLRICFDTWYSSYEDDYLINCPKLENLVLKRNESVNCYLCLVESLVTVSIELLNHCSNKDPGFSCVTALVAGVSNVKVLCLSAHCFEVGSLPVFGNLSKLKLVLHKCFPWELLTELLKRSPHLEHLVLEHSATSCNDKDSKHEAAPKPRWHPPELVPICLVSHLETVLIEGFEGQLDAMEVAKYFLRNGEALKKMTISSAPLCEEKRALYKELLMVPKVSKACIVDFI